MKKRVLPWRSVSTMSPWDREYDILEKYCEHVWYLYDCCTNLAIEIGSYHGKTTAIIAQYFPNVLAIDLWGDIHKGTEKPSTIGQESFVPFIQNMIQMELIGSVHPIVSTSKCLAGFPFLGAELVFIDASHHYEDVRVDIDQAMQHLDDNGMIIFHDYKRNGFSTYPSCEGYPYQGATDPWEGVARAVDEAIQEYDLELYDHTGGVVALKKKWKLS